MLLVTRALCTIGGAGLAVVSGFALLPTWDRKWLPGHMAAAVASNYTYFMSTFYAAERNPNWVKNKRTVESKNSNVFNSFKRYMDDPGKEKTELYYDLITNNVRITRNLNNIHSEQDEKRMTTETVATPMQQSRIDECHEWFVKIVDVLKRLDPETVIKAEMPASGFVSPFALNDAQMISLEKLIIELKTMKDDIDKLTDANMVR